MALLLSASSAVADDIPWKMEGYTEPVPASAVESATWSDLAHWEWYTAFSEPMRFLSKFATVFYLR